MKTKTESIEVHSSGKKISKCTNLAFLASVVLLLATQDIVFVLKSSCTLRKFQGFLVTLNTKCGHRLANKDFLLAQICV